MRQRYRYDPTIDKVVPAHEIARPSAGLFVISDTMPLMAHPCNGRYYDSKSRFRDETRARGCIEIGNETQVDRVDRSMPGGLRDELSRAYDQHSG
jgi:hypothetical protein